MVFMCGNCIVKHVDIDSGDQLRVCRQTYTFVHVVACDVCWVDVNVEGRSRECFLLTIVGWTLFGWDVRSFTWEGQSDRAPYEKGNANILYILSVHLQRQSPMQSCRSLPSPYIFAISSGFFKNLEKWERIENVLNKRFCYQDTCRRTDK